MTGGDEIPLVGGLVVTGGEGKAQTIKGEGFGDTRCGTIAADRKGDGMLSQAELVYFLIEHEAVPIVL